MGEIMRRTTLVNSIGEHATTFSIRKNYHSRCHIDFDMYYTLATVVGGEVSQKEDDEVIYYFVFPEYGLKIPLRTANTLLFNPSVPHSCSNPKMKDTYIMSAYVTTKTVLRTKQL